MDQSLSIPARDGQRFEHDLATGRGELERIAAKVQQHLPQAMWIAADMFRQSRLDVHNELDPLRVRLRRHCRADILDALAQLHVQSLDIQFAGLDLREIQNVVEHAQQRGCARADRLAEFPLHGLERGLQKQLGHSQHTIHRRADFVAHVGEKF